MRDGFADHAIFSQIIQDKKNQQTGQIGFGRICKYYLRITYKNVKVKMKQA
jgi:hypothetical protein